MSVTVGLSAEEVRVARFVAETKYEWCRAHGAVHTAEGQVPLDVQVEASCAELAVAKHLNLFWNFDRQRNRSIGDVGGYEVRFTSKGRLLIRPGDDLARPYVLVTGGEGVYVTRGWIRGSEVEEGWLDDFGNGRPAVYVVPSRRLHPIGP